MEEAFLDNQTSKINSGAFINLRIHLRWEECHKCATNKNYLGWNEQLDRVWMELGGDVKEDDNIVEGYEKFDVEFAKVYKPLPTSGFETIDEGLRESLTQQKKVLMKKELFLRRLQNKQGKGTAYGDEQDVFD